MPLNIEDILSLIGRRPRRPGETVDDINLPGGVVPWNPDAGIMRPGRPRRTLDHLFGDGDAVVAAALNPEGIVRPKAPWIDDQQRVNDPQLLIPRNQEAITRPRRVLVPVRPDDEFARYQGESPDSTTRPPRPGAPVLTQDPRFDPATSRVRPDNPPGEPFGSSGEPFGSTRPRRVEPRDYVADAAQYMRDVESQPSERSRVKSAGIGLVQGGIPGAIRGAARPEMYGEFKRERNLTRARTRLGEELALQTQASKMTEGAADIAYKGAQTDWMRQRPDIEANKAAEQQRRTLTSIYNRLPEFDPADPANADLVGAMTAAGLPAVPKSRANQLRFVQDARSGEWKVISGDRSTGEATGSSVTTEGGPLATTPTSTITSETANKNRTSREAVAEANRISREATAELNRRARASGARGNAREEARLTRAVKEISDLEDLKTDAIGGPVAGRTSALEKAVTKASEIRRLYDDLVEVGYGGDSEGRQWPYAKMKQQGAQGVQQSGAIGRAPASDGKHHYTAAEIRSQAGAAGVSYESLYNKLKGNQRVVIEE